jgi:hypothetical protein
VPFSPSFSNLGVRERLENKEFKETLQKIVADCGVKTVGGNDPGFRRLAPPKTSENAIAFAIAFSKVVPAHGW